MNIKEFVAELPPSMSINTFASTFDFDHKTVRRMIVDGEIACLRRPTDSIRILRPHIEDWINRCASSDNQTEETGISRGQKTAGQNLNLQVARINQMQGQS